MSSKTIEDMVDGLDKADAEWLYDIANKARAEEAELFWKRANYFWLFVAADLATYGLLWRLADGKINRNYPPPCHRGKSLNLWGYGQR